jgi:hypothetical protein
MFEEIRKFSKKTGFFIGYDKGLEIDRAGRIIKGVEKAQNELIQIKADCEQAFSDMEELTRWANANFKGRLIVDQFDSGESREARFIELYKEELILTRRRWSSIPDERTRRHLAGELSWVPESYW